MTFDSTMKFATNLTHAEIDAKLPQLKSIAEGAGLGEVAQLLGGLAGKSPAELEAGLTRSLELIGGGDDFAILFDQIDMLVVNVRNIK